MTNYLNPEQKNTIFLESNFKCKKCGFYSPNKEGLGINKVFPEVLCSVCNAFAPFEQDKFNQYVNEKIDWQSIQTFRKSGANKASHSQNKAGMVARFNQGNIMARPPFGYDVKKGQLVLNPQNSQSVRDIFSMFLKGQSLNQIAKTYGLSVNGIKKILKNFSYLGKIKFDGQIIAGNQKPIITPEVFNQAQKRFEEICKKNKLESSN
jgi:hypothetical protein